MERLTKIRPGALLMTPPEAGERSQDVLCVFDVDATEPGAFYALLLNRPTDRPAQPLAFGILECGDDTAWWGGPTSEPFALIQFSDDPGESSVLPNGERRPFVTPLAAVFLPGRDHGPATNLVGRQRLFHGCVWLSREQAQLYRDEGVVVAASDDDLFDEDPATLADRLRMGAAPAIPSNPSPLEQMYMDFSWTDERRQEHYGNVIGEQDHHLRMAQAMSGEALVEAFLKSIEAYASYANPQAFFDSREPLTADKHQPLTDADLKTSSIAWWLEERDPDLRDHAGNALGLRYVARELVPLRTSGQGAEMSGLSRASRRLDLLLATADGMPVVTEVKAKSDQHPFYGLVQALLLAAQLASPAQRARLHRRHFVKQSGPMGLCLILAANARYFFEPEGGWTGKKPEFKPQLALEAERLSAALVADTSTQRYIADITWLEARMTKTSLGFGPLRRFPSRPGTT